MTQQKSKKRKSVAIDVMKILKDERKKVKQLFQEFENLDDPSENLTDQKRDARKAVIVKELCVELAGYAQAEEEIFYPKLREAIALHGDLKEKRLLDEVAVVHFGVQLFLTQLIGTKPTDSYYNAKVRLLRRYTKHHEKILKSKIVPIIKAAKLDMHTLVEEMINFKDELRTKNKRSSGSSKRTATTKN